jgi:uncharacterized protein
MKRIILKIAILAVVLSFTILTESCRRSPQIKALILTGQNMNWKRNYIALTAILQKPGIFDTEVIISPPAGEDMSGFIVDFSPYDVVVLDYAGDMWPEQTKANFVNYVKNGGGLVVYHACSNAFPDWPEYNTMIGLSGFGNRDENWGPYVYVKDDRVVRENIPGKTGSHGYMHEFVVKALQPSHPILRGLPEEWMHGSDELYDSMRGQGDNMEVLAYACSDTSMLGTGRNEPVLMTISYGKGRVFHTTLGHTWDELFSLPLECAGFITTFQRGAEWAATGKVTQEVPSNFPGRTKSVRWKYYEGTSGGIEPFVARMQAYKTGSSTGCFVIFKDIIRENSGNPAKMKEYNELIRKMLESGRSTDDCKKILMREFSWMADDPMKDVYEKMKSDSRLSVDAQYALQVIDAE